MGTSLCRECKLPLNDGMPYVYIGNRPGTQASAKSGGKICLECVKEFQIVPTIPSNMPEFVEWYWRNKLPARVSNKRLNSLEQQNEMLRRLLKSHNIDVEGL